VTGTQAIILAGGAGTRLRPLTTALPKPVVPLLNRPFLSYQLALLRQHGVTDVVLSCSYRTDDVRAALGNGEAFGMKLRYAVEVEPLGTGGGVRNAADLEQGGLFVLNGDILTDADLGAMRAFHAASGSRTTIVLTRVENPRAYGLVEQADDGRVRRFREKPGPEEPVTTDTVNAGIYYIDAALLDRIPRDRPVSLEREFFPGLLADGVPVFGWESTAYWRDIGNPSAYLAAHVDLAQGRVRTPLRPPGVARDGNWVGSRVVIEPGATLEAPCVLGAGIRLRAGSHVGPHVVIGDDTVIDEGARVEQSVLWDRISVGAGSELHGCIVGSRARIGARVEIMADTVVEPDGVVPDGTRLGTLRAPSV
jgi:NDP-sugar pyrophosphorylase family protein